MSPGYGGDDDEASFASLLEDSAEDLYENAPCGYLSTLLDGQIAKVNATLLGWLGYRREDLVGARRFSDLLTVGGKLYHETHFAPLLRMQGQVTGIALELKAAGGTRLPVLVSSTVKTGADGEALLIRTTLFDARDRRAYENELLRARNEAENARLEADRQRGLAELERERLQRLATTLQRTLLPPTLPAPPGLEVAAHYHVASRDKVGGDFYDLFPLAGGRWALFMGDVCGKGAAAAAVTSLARYTLRTAAVYDSDPAGVLRSLNTELIREYRGTEATFCTVVFALLTPVGGAGAGIGTGIGTGYDVVLASGGHPASVLLGSGGRASYLPTPGGQLIGILPEPRIATTRVRLAPGETLLFYTDGLTEAHKAAAAADDPAAGERYGDRALLEFADRLAPATAQAAISALTALLDTFGHGLDDDTALLAVGVPALSPADDTACSQDTGTRT